MSLIVKICGLSTPDTLEAALAGGADMVGFVFFPASPRHVGLDAAARLAAQVGGRAAKVALSVDADDAALEAVIAALRPDLLQLHGQEPAARVAAVRKTFGRPVIKALPVATAADLAAIAVYAPVADRLLFDARPPAGATRPGGLGRSFDWGLLEKLEIPVPFMLSGGLDPHNVADAVAQVRPGGVDVSSGVESRPGEKDPAKIRAFIRAARDAAARLAAHRVASTA
jgi:phosphoribosylanthranilate isomerase